jgi:ABC-type anion transport system duplicated permease subunit
MKGDNHVYKVNCQSCVFSVVSSCYIRPCAVWVRRRDKRILRPRVYVLLRADNRVLRPSVYVLLRADHSILRPSVYVLLRAEPRILRPIALYELLRTVSLLLLSAVLWAALYALVAQRSVASFITDPGIREDSGQGTVGGGQGSGFRRADILVRL